MAVSEDLAASVERRLGVLEGHVRGLRERVSDMGEDYDPEAQAQLLTTIHGDVAGVTEALLRRWLEEAFELDNLEDADRHKEQGRRTRALGRVIKSRRG